MGDLRPIALCNVSYKILSKVLANRMRGLIDHVISPTQSAFIPGRLISDNIMVAFEIMHYLKWKTKGKKGFMAMKFDMSKTYDRVELDYLRAFMHCMGFSGKWINLIMKCVTFVRGSIIHNGHIMGPITPSSSPNTEATQRHQICTSLGMPEATDDSLYLGLPNIIGRKKTPILEFLKNKVINRI
uniref:Reverse transcriptase domain-containing protein n=1 Tax=Cannabis sativa TaxID=3483 RepID=A0A803NP10_CANSA